MKKFLVSVVIVISYCGCIPESPTDSAIREAREREKQEAIEQQAREQERSAKRIAYISAMNPLMTRVNTLFIEIGTTEKLWNSQVLNPQFNYFITEYARLDGSCTTILNDSQKVTPYYDINGVTQHQAFIDSIQLMLNSIKEMRSFLDAKGIERSTLQANIYANQSIAKIQIFSDWYTKL